ncbi:serine/threonine-protein phosphatase [Mycolicibacterium austroafricanum]|uniref:PP2C family protein-serine/threonine phosphatase n=1 Tax=Mycolicibacterium austroafricanum TaxID=39687 RepID=A0ABT8HPW3_MYCAO|nr:PP2C family protein-serine/threonine phosphatase [Mycolicibacterium austroafricanum]MDN4522799.1 PP2C family protein-serine/threonine phosphatase [Mycolicibacterium austroafricanum]QRZ06856.1 serine/threonine-protein phosphatase [Mycolicibacterium austroafricanum]QZT56943.1 serine/threonine-protein phosphatase [Mycolicibacterium austroafricanum]QZT68338.1 serine/threonine-protein phosphatase [Mycolicibacterium austroafricanum]
MGAGPPLDVDSGNDAAWAAVPHPVLVVDRDGIVRTSSGSARSLLPGLSPGVALKDLAPSWLSGAHQHLTAASGSVHGRDFDAHPTPLPGGEVAWWLVEDSDRSARDARRALTVERERAAFLDEASAVLMASLNIDRCMEATVQMAARHLADAAVLVTPVAGGRIPVVCSGTDGTAEHRRVDADPSDVAGLSEALRGFPPVPSRWIDPASVPGWLVPESFPGPVGSVVITPLPGHGIAAGALVLLRRTSQTAFSEGEEVFARLFAARAGAALSAARLYAEQSAITRTLLRDLLPPQLHRLDGIELAGGYRASEDHEAVGGDFYDVHPAATPDDETLVVLGDVCGKGLEAAVLTGKIRNTLMALSPLAQDHAGVLRLLNAALLCVDDSRFATLVLASVSRRDGQVLLRLTSAGHLAPLIVRNDGRVEEAETAGTLVGVMPQIRARTVETSLAPGETCLLYTDGVTEARGGPLGTDMFGEQRLSAALAECAGLPAEAVVERIMMLTTGWLNERAHDDIAVVAITAPRRTHLSAVDGRTAGRYTA